MIDTLSGWVQTLSLDMRGRHAFKRLDGELGLYKELHQT